MKLRDVLKTTLMGALVAGGPFLMTASAEPGHENRDEKKADWKMGDRKEEHKERGKDKERQKEAGKYRDGDKKKNARERDRHRDRDRDHRERAKDDDGEKRQRMERGRFPGAGGSFDRDFDGAPHGGDGMFGEHAGMGTGLGLARMGKRALFPFWEKRDIANELDLSKDQIAALEESLEITRNDLEQSKGSVLDHGKEIKSELEKDNPDLDTVYELSDEASAEFNEKAKTILGHIVTVKTVLTAEQEENLRPVIRRGVRARFDEMRDVRGEVREIVRSGGTIDEVKALLEEHDIPDMIQERVLDRVEEAIEWHESGERSGRGEDTEKPGRPSQDVRPERREILERWERRHKNN